MTGGVCVLGVGPSGICPGGGGGGGGCPVTHRVPSKWS